MPENSVPTAASQALAQLGAAVTEAREYHRIAEAEITHDPASAAAHCQIGILGLLTVLAAVLQEESG